MQTQLVKPIHTNTDFEVRSLDLLQAEQPKNESLLSYLKYLIMGVTLRYYSRKVRSHFVVSDTGNVQAAKFSHVWCNRFSSCNRYHICMAYKEVQHQNN